MKQEPHTLRRAAGLLLAATALPHNALLAQETPPAAPSAATPVVVAPPPAPIVTAPAPVAVQPAPAPAPTPVPTMEPIIYKGPPPEETPAASEPVRPRAARVASRTASRPRATAPAPAAEPVVEAAPAPDFTLAPMTEAPATAPMAELPAPPPVAAEPTPPATDPAQPDRPAGLAWLWLFGAALAAVAAILLFRRRRRSHDDHARAPRAPYDDANMLATGAPSIAPLAYEAAPAAAATAAAAVAASPERASLDLQMRPVRAGVTDDDAVVEFELTIDNQGSGAARDVRISTWMFPAGSPRSEMESLLIGPDAEADLIGAGDRKSFETQVALPTAGIAQDSVLPVVVAEARYRLEDGSEQRASASFAVGVPLGDELAHFDLENPSGLHEGVEARPLGEPQKA